MVYLVIFQIFLSFWIEITKIKHLYISISPWSGHADKDNWGNHPPTPMNTRFKDSPTHPYGHRRLRKPSSLPYEYTRFRDSPTTLQAQMIEKPIRPPLWTQRLKACMHLVSLFFPILIWTVGIWLIGLWITRFLLYCNTLDTKSRINNGNLNLDMQRKWLLSTLFFLIT